MKEAELNSLPQIDDYKTNPKERAIRKPARLWKTAPLAFDVAGVVGCWEAFAVA